jgi:ABC transporter substrate binding protein
MPARAISASSSPLGQEVVVFGAKDEQEIDNSFAALAQRRVGALVVTADGFLISRRDQIVALAQRYTVPTMYPLSQYVAAGGLMSYGANLPDVFLQTGIYVGKSLNGAKPARRADRMIARLHHAPRRCGRVTARGQGACNQSLTVFCLGGLRRGLCGSHASLIWRHCRYRRYKNDGK